MHRNIFNYQAYVMPTGRATGKKQLVSFKKMTRLDAVTCEYIIRYLESEINFFKRNKPTKLR